MHQAPFILTSPPRPIRPLGAVGRVPCARCDSLGVVEREVAGVLQADICPRCNGHRYIEAITK